MPTPIDNKPGARYSIKIDKDDLTNNSQYNDAVSWVAGRIIRPFGLHYFILIVIRWMGHGEKVDGRKKVYKDLSDAEDKLLQAATDYDNALRAVRESKVRGKKP